MTGKDMCVFGIGVWNLLCWFASSWRPGWNTLLVLTNRMRPTIQTGGAGWPAPAYSMPSGALCNCASDRASEVRCR